MILFNWVAAIIIITSLIYVSFVLTLAEWISALRKGQAVTLLPERGKRNYPLWTQIAIALLGLVICAVLFYFLWIPLFAIPAGTAFVLDIIGLILYVAGCAFVLWARKTLGKMWGLSTSRDVKLLDNHRIVQTGPYAFVRNPMYFGWWVAMFGLVLLYPVWMMVLMFLFSVDAVSLKTKREDAALSERFGEAWASYKKRTKFLIPYIY